MERREEGQMSAKKNVSPSICINNDKDEFDAGHFESGMVRAQSGQRKGEYQEIEHQLKEILLRCQRKGSMIGGIREGKES